MSGDLRILAEHLASVDGQRSERAAEVAARVRIARRRRRAAAGTAVVAMVLAAVIGGVLLVRDPHPGPPEPIKRPDQTATVDPISGARKLTYANGSTIHWGDRAIDTGLDLDALYVTDNGVAFTTTDRKVWFTDLDSITQLGDLGDADEGSYEFGFDQRLTASSGNSGTLFAWYEVAHGQQSLVVRDTSDGSEVLRTKPVEHPYWKEQILAVLDDRIYVMCAGRGDLCVVSHDDWPRGGTDPRLARYDLNTGERVLVPVKKYQEDLRRQSRTLVVGDNVASGEPLVGPGVTFEQQRSRWAAVLAGSDPLDHASAFVSETARPIDLRLPEQPADRRFLRISQWLDGDTVAVWAGSMKPPAPMLQSNYAHSAYDPQAVFICVLSTGQCELVVDGPEVDRIPGVPGRNAEAP